MFAHLHKNVKPSKSFTYKSYFQCLNMFNNTSHIWFRDVCDVCRHLCICYSGVHLEYINTSYCIQKYIVKCLITTNDWITFIVIISSNIYVLTDNYCQRGSLWGDCFTVCIHLFIVLKGYILLTDYSLF